MILCVLFCCCHVSMPEDRAGRSLKNWAPGGHLEVLPDGQMDGWPATAGCAGTFSGCVGGGLLSKEEHLTWRQRRQGGPTGGRGSSVSCEGYSTEMRGLQMAMWRFWASFGCGALAERSGESRSSGARTATLLLWWVGPPTWLFWGVGPSFDCVGGWDPRLNALRAGTLTWLHRGTEGFSRVAGPPCLSWPLDEPKPLNNISVS